MENIINIFNVARETWNDWKWQMAMRGKCSDIGFLKNIGLLSDWQGDFQKKISLTPYAIRLLLYLRETNPQAYRAEWLQSFLPRPAKQTSHQWVWARKNKVSNFLLKWVETLFYGKGSDTPIEALENFYPNTDILVATAVCARSCSFCFREVGDASGEAASLTGDMSTIMKAVQKIISRKTAHVLITGGDPLTRNNKQLRQILEPLIEADSVKVVRIATRMVVDLPMRFHDQDLLGLLQDMSKKISNRGGNLRIVTQINHPAELTEEALTAIKNIQKCGIEVLSQTVALKNVNDNPLILQSLFMRLDALKVRPYKFFHTMPVYGTDHLRVPLRIFRKLVGQLHQWIPGTSVPQSNIPTLIGKIAVHPKGQFSISLTFTRRILTRNWRGEWYLYKDAPDPQRRFTESILALLIIIVLTITTNLPVPAPAMPFNRISYPEDEIGYTDHFLRQPFKPFISKGTLYLPKPK